LDELLSREEVLAGLPARRARSLLFQIEMSTVRAVESRRHSVLLLGLNERLLRLNRTLDRSREADADTGDQDWFQAFRTSRDGFAPPTIRQIERFAPEWTSLIPAQPRLRAALANLLGKTYRFTAKSIPNIRAALGLDTPEVQQAYEQLYRAPLSGLFAPGLNYVERFRWALNAVLTRLDNLTPFWLAFTLCLLGNAPEGILILPMAVAQVGPPMGLALICLIGTINTITLACMAEAVVRTGSIHYRNFFLGRVTGNYLGRTGSLLAYYNTLIQMFMILLAGIVVVVPLLRGVVPLPGIFWIAGAASVLIYRLWHSERTGSISTDILLGGACVSLILLLSAFALTHLHPALLRHVNPNFMDPDHVDLSVLGVVFGTAIACFSGHNVIPLAAKLVLPKDPGGRTLIRGTVAGGIAALALQCLWLIAVSGAVSSKALLDSHETAAQPLGTLLGPAVAVIAGGTVLLFAALDTTGSSDILFSLIRERLPAVVHTVAVLSRNKDRLVFHPRHALGPTPRVGLTFMGASREQARFRVDVLQDFSVKRIEITVTGRWEISELYAEFPALSEHRFRLNIELLGFEADAARVLVTTPMQISREAGRKGTAGLLFSVDLSDDERQLLRWLLSAGDASAAEAATEHQWKEADVTVMLTHLAAQGLISRTGSGEPARYRPRWQKRTTRALPQNIWQKLDAPDQGAAPEPVKPARARREGLRARIGEALQTENGRFAVAASPVVLAALAAVILVELHAPVFERLMEFCGLMTVIISAGIIPTLLVAACRSKGLHDPTGGRWLLYSHQLPIILYPFFLLLLTLHGFVFLRAPLERATALAVAAVIVFATVSLLRQRTFSGRLSIELREDLRANMPAVFRITANGKRLAAHIGMHYSDNDQQHHAATGEIASFSTLRSIEFQLPAIAARELRIWSHRVTPDGDSESLPARLHVRSGDSSHEYDLGLHGGEIVMPYTGKPVKIQIVLEDPDAEPVQR
jgi:hypothetical protein